MENGHNLNNGGYFRWIVFCGRGWPIINSESVITVVTMVLKIAVNKFSKSYNSMESNIGVADYEDSSWPGCEQNKMVQCQYQYEN